MENLKTVFESVNRTLEGQIGTNKDRYQFSFDLNNAPVEVNFTVVDANNQTLVIGSYKSGSKQFSPSVLNPIGFDWSIFGTLLQRCEGIVAELTPAPAETPAG